MVHGIKIAEVNTSFWKNKRVFLTGHTGFKGGWLALWLTTIGAKVTGYSLAPNAGPNFFEAAKVEGRLVQSHIADIRDLQEIQKAMTISQPEIVIHMAAQSLVRNSYSSPVETYSTNVMGTVHVMESIRSLDCVRAVLIVTTDKCYENKEWVWGYRENDVIGGRDPYSNSKGCAELVTSAYRESFFPKENFVVHRVAIASVRAGNVVGGGDWSDNRLIPDAIKAFEANQTLLIRNPLAKRPWQHVLEPLSGYLLLAEALYHSGMKFEGAWNFGPNHRDTRSVQEVINLLISNWKEKANWQPSSCDGPHEANSLFLDCSKAHRNLNWFPRWDLENAIKNVVQWHQGYQMQKDMQALSLQQISSYIKS